MIGLPNAAKPVFRAYSIASPSWDEELEFFSIKVPDGPLTQHLQKILPGDTVLMRQKSTGTLVVDALTPAKRLWMISTGTGIAPFASLLRDPETYDRFEEVILTHTCRDAAELDYGDELAADLRVRPADRRAAAGTRLYFTTTREPSRQMGRITDLIRSGKLFRSGRRALRSARRPRDDLWVDRHDPRRQGACRGIGLEEGSNAKPADSSSSALSSAELQFTSWRAWGAIMATLRCNCATGAPVSPVSFPNSLISDRVFT